MIRYRWSHWTCSKFADFIRGTDKPYGLGWDEWGDWHKDAKKKHPFRYWLAENFLRKLQNLFCYPKDLYNTIVIYIRNRWIDQTHILKTGLKPGQYHEFDYKVLYGLFNELSDYVELELAYTMKVYSERNYKFVKGRCARAGLDHLDDSISLVYNEDWGVNKDDEKYGQAAPQAISAQKVKDLYLWWTETRPNRPDPWKTAGLDRFNQDGSFMHKYSKEERQAFNLMQKIEKQYEKEDTDKLIELIKIRHEIWV